jgi:hypothetical protein
MLPGQQHQLMAGMPVPSWLVAAEGALRCDMLHRQMSNK